MRVYICPQHPEKTYTSWRKFRGHWSTRHKGEECPPREEFMQEREKEEVIEEKAEKREEKKEKAEEGAFPEFTLPEDPVPRLAKILEVNGVPVDIQTQIIGVFQLHPAYRENPVNLHYLLTAKLPRKLHPSIPLMVSAFTTPGEGYPEGIPIMGMPGMPGQGGMPPFMYGGGYPPQYPPTYGLQPFYKQPIGGREGGEEEAGRGRVKESNPVQDAVALLGTIIELKDKLIPNTGGGTPTVQEIFEGFRSTVEELTKSSTEQQDKLIKKMEEGEENRKKDIEVIKETLHTAEKGRLQDKIDTLEHAKDEETSEGLGALIREAGEGVATQAEGIRESVTKGVEKIGDIAEKVVSVEGPPKLPINREVKGKVGVKTVGGAKELLEAESEVEGIAKELEGGQS